jgi:Na+-transporting methylmalonyl-CoA/oxaloacetate decarboxylase gamma subunit
MHILLATLTIAFVVAVLLLVAFVLFTLSPFASHTDRYHEPGQRQNSPRLD